MMQTKEKLFEIKSKIRAIRAYGNCSTIHIGFPQSNGELQSLPPNIEPTATGHIIEQIEMIQAIIANGFAYESNGSVYFDVEGYAENHNYGSFQVEK